MNFINDNNSLKDLAKRSSFNNNIFEKIIKKENSKNILIIEDSEVEQKILENGLQKSINLKVNIIDNGIDAISFIRKDLKINDIDIDMVFLIVVDLVLGDVSAVKVIEELERKSFKTPVFIYSSSDQLPTVVKMMKMKNVNNFFSKSRKDDFQRFLKCVEEELNNRK
tara:strand:- start:2749 stop:3249 length:501 start_codon:yes stop_codon:yes gene_type:complete